MNNSTITDLSSRFAQALNTSIGGLDCDQLDKAINALDYAYKNKGSIIISGVGKTGIIGQLLASGLKSIRINAFFVHSSEAAHGDLGAIGSNDLVVIMSKSGQSAETFALIDYCIEQKINTLGIGMNASSYLMKKATYKIILSTVEEELPVKVLPSTSNIVFVALCEAIKIKLALLQNLTTEDFVKTHPGGKIGNKQTKINDIMRTNNRVPIIQQDTAMTTAIQEISNKKCGCVLICDNDNKMLGIITDGDLRRLLLTSTDFMQQQAQQIMHSNPIHLNPQDSLETAELIMAEQGLSQLPVLLEDKVVGIVHIGDLVRSDLESFDVTMDRKV